MPTLETTVIRHLSAESYGQYPYGLVILLDSGGAMPPEDECAELRVFWCRTYQEAMNALRLATYIEENSTAQMQKVVMSLHDSEPSEYYAGVRDGTAQIFKSDKVFQLGDTVDLDL